MITNNKIILTAPHNQATEISFSEVSDTSLRLTLTRGNGRSILITARLSSSVRKYPFYNNTYTASSVFGSGSNLGDGTYVVYIGNDRPINLHVTGLTNNTEYTFEAFEFNFTQAGTEKYNQTPATGNPSSQTTSNVVLAPSVQATNVIWAGDRKIKWTAGNGIRKIVLIKEGGPVDANPVDGVSYTPDSDFGSGDEIGTGNFVVYDGTENEFYLNPDTVQFDTAYGVRVYEYNVSSGSNLYFTNTATGNPLAHNTGIDEEWYLHHNPVITNFRGVAFPRDVSQCASKMYTGSFAESATHFYIFCIGDTQDVSPYSKDQVFRFKKSKSDLLPFTEGWSADPSDATGPLPVLPFGHPTDPTLSNQQWLGNIEMFSDTDWRASYSANGPGIATRYSNALATSDDEGETWTKGQKLLSAGTSKSYFQFQHRIYDADLDRWFIFSPNVLSTYISQDRSAAMEVWGDNDSGAGLSFVKIDPDIYGGTPIDDGGFALQGPPWKESGKWWAYATTGELPNYNGRSPESVNPIPVYRYLQKQVILISCEDITVNNQEWIIEKVLYSGDQQSFAGLFPGSVKISHGGIDHIIVSCFLWKVEGATSSTAQQPIDIRVLSNSPITDNGGQVVGRNVYPGYAKRFYKMHQTHLDDTFEGVCQPVEVITDTAGTIIGTNPAQFILNLVNVPVDGYIQFPSFTHDQQKFGVKLVADSTDGITSELVGLMEKEGSFKITFYNERRVEVTVYGVGGGYKQFRLTVKTSVYRHGLYTPEYLTDIGFTTKLNDDETDLDVYVNIDYSLNVAVETINNDSFTQIVQNANPVTFGHVNGITNRTNFIGSCIVMWGDQCTQENWLLSNLT